MTYLLLFSTRMSFFLNFGGHFCGKRTIKDYCMAMLLTMNHFMIKPLKSKGTALILLAHTEHLNLFAYLFYKIKYFYNELY